MFTGRHLCSQGDFKEIKGEIFGSLQKRLALLKAHISLQLEKIYM